MSSPRFHHDGPINMIQVQQALNNQSLQLNTEMEKIVKEQEVIKKDLKKLNKNIEKLIEVLNQSNPRAKNLMIRSYSTHKVVSNFIKEPKSEN